MVSLDCPSWYMQSDKEIRLIFFHHSDAYVSVPWPPVDPAVQTHLPTLLSAHWLCKPRMYRTGRCSCTKGSHFSLHMKKPEFSSFSLWCLDDWNSTASSPSEGVLAINSLLLQGYYEVLPNMNSRLSSTKWPTSTKWNLFFPYMHHSKTVAFIVTPPGENVLDCLIANMGCTQPWLWLWGLEQSWCWATEWSTARGQVPLIRAGDWQNLSWH